MTTGKPFKRNSKFWGIIATPELKNTHEKTVIALNEISGIIRNMLVKEEIVKIEKHKLVMNNNFMSQFMKTTTIKPKDKKRMLQLQNNIIRDTDIKDICKDVFSKIQDPQNKNESYNRTLVKYILERYSGYLKRNKNVRKGKIPQIRIHREKNIYFKDNSAKLCKNDLVLIEKGPRELMLKTLDGHTTVKYSNSIRESELRGCGFGGNLTYHPKTKTYCMIGAVDIKFKPLYEPKGYLSFDLNKTPQHWIVLFDGQNTKTISMPKKIKKLTKEIAEANKLLADKLKPIKERLYRTKQRRKQRTLWLETHKKLKGQVQIVSRKIVNKAKKLKLLLCIDSVKGGDQMGTFAQDYLIPQIQTICENEGVPFYVVPCKNTSRMCSQCGYTKKINRKTTNEFECKKCKHAEISHHNAAKNIRNIGIKFHKAGIEYANYKDLTVQQVLNPQKNNPQKKKKEDSMLDFCKSIITAEDLVKEILVQKT